MSKYLPIAALQKLDVKMFIKFSNGVNYVPYRVEDALATPPASRLIVDDIIDCTIWTTRYYLDGKAHESFLTNRLQYQVEEYKTETPYEFTRSFDHDAVITTQIDAYGALTMVMWYIRAIDDSNRACSIYYDMDQLHFLSSPEDDWYPSLRYQALSCQLTIDSLPAMPELPGYIYTQLFRKNIRCGGPQVLSRGAILVNCSLNHIHMHPFGLRYSELQSTGFLPSNYLSKKFKLIARWPKMVATSVATLDTRHQLIIKSVCRVMYVIDGGMATKYFSTL
jgi:hypothetical protein